MALSFIPPIAHLKNEETTPVFAYSFRTPTSEKKLFQIMGNSILSSVYINNIDPGATLDVKYFQTTSATEPEGELQQLNFHRQFTSIDNGQTDTILVSRIHNKPQCQFTLIGGNATFGVYGSVRSTTTSDIDTALKLDAQIANLLVDKGIPTMLFDEAAGKFFFMRGFNGVLPISVGEEGPKFQELFYGLSTPNTEQTLIDTIIDPDTIVKISVVRICCRSHSIWILEKQENAENPVTDPWDYICSGRTSPQFPVDYCTISPREILEDESKLRLRFLQIENPAIQIEALVIGVSIPE